MPSDITGSDILEEDQTTGKRVFRFIRGPIFANIVLADEINRTPPKTQAALLQSMQGASPPVVRPTSDPPFWCLRRKSDRTGRRIHFPKRSSTASCCKSMSAIRRWKKKSRSSSAARQRTKPVIQKSCRPSGSCAASRPDAARSRRRPCGALRRRSVMPPGPSASPVPAPIAQAAASVWPADPKPKRCLWSASIWPMVPGRVHLVFDPGRQSQSDSGRPSRRVDRRCASAGRPVLQHRLIVNFHAEAEGIGPQVIIDKLLEAIRP